MQKLFRTGIEIADIDLVALEDSVTDVEDWILAMVQGKINNSRSRMRDRWVDKLIDDPAFNDPLPSDEDQLLDLISKRPDYKKRSERPNESPR